jgi:hypothetical protein
MTEINLLPGNLVRTSSVSKIIKALKKVNVVGTIVLGFIFLVISGGLAFNTVSLNNINASVESLKIKVKTMDSAEQQYYFVKGRLASISKIFQEVNVGDDITNFKNLYPTIKDYGEISTTNIKPGMTELTLTFNSTSKIKELITKLPDSNYSRIVVNGISFSPNIGYQAIINLYK